MEIKVGNIYAFKMTSGQEIVAKLSDMDDNYYHLAGPLTIAQGASGMEFIPAMFCAAVGEDSLMLKTSVDFISNAREDIKEVYEESLNPSSVIKPGKKQIITG